MDNNTSTKKERAVLAGLSALSMDEHERSTEVSMDELAALVETAGGEAVAMLIQNRATPEPRSFIGDGKVVRRDYSFSYLVATGQGGDLFSDTPCETFPPVYFLNLNHQAYEN